MCFNSIFDETEAHSAPHYIKHLSGLKPGHGYTNCSSMHIKRRYIYQIMRFRSMYCFQFAGTLTCTRPMTPALRMFYKKN